MARYPSPASHYFIEPFGELFDVWHDHFGHLRTVDCRGEAENVIADFEDDDTDRAAAGAREVETGLIADALALSVERAA